MSAPARVALIAAAAARALGSPAAPACRDPFLWPFAADSIWNTPIGSAAIYEPAGIYRDASGPLGPPTSFHNDQELLVLSTSTDPLVDWMDDSGNFPGGCAARGPVRQQLPLPHDFVTDCVANNNAAAVLLPDNDTLVQMQPLYRPSAGGPIVAWWHHGAPQPFPWSNSVHGDGALGAHGGSGLSAIGGAIRLGELLPGAPPIAHALKLEVWAHAYYFYNWSSGEYSSCFTWPAVGCDSYYNVPGAGYNGTTTSMKPGALLAVPPAAAARVAAALKTEPARRVLAALRDYGGYLVDDTGSSAGGGALCMERGVTAELRAAYNVSVAIEDPLSPRQGAPLYDDLVEIFRALSVVVNNAPHAVGGGGTPRAPPPPPFCPA
jgi:hypothetical protein